MADEKKPRSSDDDAAVLLSLTRDFLKLDPEEREKARRTGEETIELDEADSTGGHRSANPDLTLPRTDTRRTGARPVTRKKASAKSGEGRGIFIMRALLGFMVTLLILGVAAGLVKKSRRARQSQVATVAAPKAETGQLEKLEQASQAYFAKAEEERRLEDFQALLARADLPESQESIGRVRALRRSFASEGARLNAARSWRTQGMEAVKSKDWKLCDAAFSAWTLLEPANATAQGFRDMCRGKSK